MCDFVWMLFVMLLSIIFIAKVPKQNAMCVSRYTEKKTIIKKRFSIKLIPQSQIL